MEFAYSNAKYYQKSNMYLGKNTKSINESLCPICKKDPLQCFRREIPKGYKIYFSSQYTIAIASVNHLNNEENLKDLLDYAFDFVGTYFQNTFVKLIHNSRYIHGSNCVKTHLSVKLVFHERKSKQLFDSYFKSSNGIINRNVYKEIDYQNISPHKNDMVTHIPRDYIYGCNKFQFATLVSSAISKPIISEWYLFITLFRKQIIKCIVSFPV